MEKKVYQIWSDGSTAVIRALNTLRHDVMAIDSHQPRFRPGVWVALVMIAAAFLIAARNSIDFKVEAKISVGAGRD